MKLQRNIVQRGCDILIASPGRLKDLLGQEAINCKFVKFLVLDEADVMLDYGFIDDIKYIR